MNKIKHLLIRLRFRNWVLVRVPVDEGLPNLQEEDSQANYKIIEEVIESEEGLEIKSRPMTPEEWEKFYQGGEGMYTSHTVFNIDDQAYSLYHPATRRYYEYVLEFGRYGEHARFIKALLEAGIPVIDAESLSNGSESSCLKKG
jgi:hypothetical protein